STHDAVMAGGEKRLRPILMTALATIFALTPMALGITGHGGFISQPLAIVVIGGLISSTVLTLIVLPTPYNLVEGAKERRALRRGDGGQGADAAPQPLVDGPVSGAADAPAPAAPAGSPVGTAAGSAVTAPVVQASTAASQAAEAASQTVVSDTVY